MRIPVVFLNPSRQMSVYYNKYVWPLSTSFPNSLVSTHPTSKYYIYQTAEIVQLNKLTKKTFLKKAKKVTFNVVMM